MEMDYNLKKLANFFKFFLTVYFGEIYSLFFVEEIT